MKILDFTRIREILSAFRLSWIEWVAAVVTVGATILLVAFYLNSTQPLQSKLDDLKRRERVLQNQIRDEGEKHRAVEEQRANSEKIVESLDHFETRLRNRKQGIPAIIDEVNRLAKENKVRAGDISFRTDAPEPLPGTPQSASTPGASASVTPRKRNDKLINVYEGLGIDTTVEGDYHDLRRFIAAFERSRNFVIINSLTLQSVDEKARSRFTASAVPATAAAPGPGMQTAGGRRSIQQAPVEAPEETGGTTSVIVSLKIEMETHFSREYSSGNPGAAGAMPRPVK